MNAGKFNHFCFIMPKNVVCFKTLKLTIPFPVIKLLNISDLREFNFKQLGTQLWGHCSLQKELQQQ